MNDNVEYKKVEETKDSYKKQLYWNMAIGLQQVDGLTPSSYLKELVSKNIKGEIINYEVEESLHTYYKTRDLSNIKILKDNTVIYADYNEIIKNYLLKIINHERI
ncbi:MAG: hypothetical protein PHF21_02910 [Bacilli bacterium]|nr:hypothetical protein [Bacilli bacterium]